MAVSTSGEAVLAGKALAMTTASSERAVVSHTARLDLTHELTKSEVQVLALLASGMTAPEIARMRWNSASTIRRHICSVHLKLGARTNAGAVAVAYEAGILRST